MFERARAVVAWAHDAVSMLRGFVFVANNGYAFGDGDLPLLNLRDPKQSSAYVTIRVIELRRELVRAYQEGGRCMHPVLLEREPPLCADCGVTVTDREAE